MTNTQNRFQMNDQIRRYDFADTGEIRELVGTDQAVVYWRNHPGRRPFFSLERTEHLALVKAANH